MQRTGKNSGSESRTLGIIAVVRLAAPEPEVLRLIGEESQRKGTDTLCSRQID